MSSACPSSRRVGSSASSAAPISSGRYSNNLAEPAAQPAGDEMTGDAEIRERILAAVARQPWGPRASVDVSVTAGTVELYGSITDDRERTALQVLAESIPGVKGVRDNLVWVEPVSGFVIPAEGSKPPTNA